MAASPDEVVAGPKSASCLDIIFFRAEQFKAAYGLDTAKLVQVAWMLHEYKHMTERRGHGKEPWDSSVEWTLNVIKICIKCVLQWFARSARMS